MSYPPLASAADFQGQTLRFMGSCQINVGSSLSPATKLFTTNESDMRAGSKKTFVFALTTDAGGPPLAGVLLSAGTDALVTDWNTGMDPSVHLRSGACFYPPQAAPVYPNGLGFFVKPTAGVAGLGILTISAFGWWC